LAQASPFLCFLCILLLQKATAGIANPELLDILLSSTRLHGPALVDHPGQPFYTLLCCNASGPKCKTGMNDDGGVATTKTHRTMPLLRVWP
jgi:hypothetical protein